MLTAGPTNVDARHRTLAATTAGVFPTLWHGVLAFACLIGFYTFRDMSHALSTSGIVGLIALTVISLAIGLGGRHVRYDHFSSFYGSLTRMTAAGVAVYILAEPPDFTLAHPAALALHRWVTLSYVPAFLIAITALFRPSFLLVPAI